MPIVHAAASALLTALAALCAGAQRPPMRPANSAPAAAAPPALAVPVDYYRLPNGLKVVISTDSTTPTAVIAVYYNIGFRIEPRNRTGFAHLFEHLMFQGSQNLGKQQFIHLVESNGGVLNGSTRFDFTNYFQIVPSNAVETMLWAEADRMTGLAIDTANVNNQRDVVKNEVRVNVLNQPYGSFPWIDLPMQANTNWYNAPKIYGDLGDLDAATLDDARDFFRTYYAPNNAGLVITGAVSPTLVKQWVGKYFAPIKSAPQPARPDIAEPPQLAERRASRVDALANRPAIAIAYHVPARYTPEWYAFGLIDQMLAQGRDSRFYAELVRGRGLTGGIEAGINFGLGSMYDYDGPMLWIVDAYHDVGTPSDSLLLTGH